MKLHIENPNITKKVEHYKVKKEWKIIMFLDIKTEKRNIHRNKKSTFLEVVDIDNIFLSKKVSSGEENHKYFVGYVHDDNNWKIREFYIMPPNMSAYVKSFNGESKWIHFLIENDELLKNVMTFWINSKIVF